MFIPKYTIMTPITTIVAIFISFSFWILFADANEKVMSPTRVNHHHRTTKQNVLSRVASIQANSTSSERATKIQRPSFVPEKLNFAAYEVFEGEWKLRGSI